MTKKNSGHPDQARQCALKGSPIFVVHKHAASHLHYDLRLEVDGVLVSWAVPKGPSIVVGEKRLAVHVPDHDLEYASFEGTIPEGSYGAGVVEIWDHGTYDNLKDRPMNECVKKGRIEITFHGKKLKGAYALVQTTMHNDTKNWLLFRIDS